MNIFKDGLKFKKVIEEIDFSTYAAIEGDPPPVYVWVNLDGETMDEFHALQELLKGLTEQQARIVENINKLDPDKTPERVEEFTKKLKALAPKMKDCNNRIFAWYAKVWSQHDDESSHVSAAELREFAKRTQADETAFWDWLQRETQVMILAYNNRQIKNLKAPS